MAAAARVTSPEAVASGVGPVLQSTPLARAMVAAIEDDNDQVTVYDEGAYLRVVVPRVCRLSRRAVEDRTGSGIEFPGDLEVIMSSFAGLVRLTADEAVWWRAGEAPPEATP